MANWWELQEDSAQEPQFAYRAVAYYRHSAQDRQENSISIQQDQVRSWAESNGVEIIHEFMDPGKSGLSATELVAGNQSLARFVEAVTNNFRSTLASPKLLVYLGLGSRQASDGRAIRSSSLHGTKLFV